MGREQPRIPLMKLTDLPAKLQSGLSSRNLDVDLPWSFADVDAAWWTLLYKPSEKADITDNSIAVHAKHFTIQMRRQELTIGSTRYTLHFSNYRGDQLPAGEITFRSMVGRHTRLTVEPASLPPAFDRPLTENRNGHPSRDVRHRILERQVAFRAQTEHFMARLVQHFLAWFEADQPLITADAGAETGGGVGIGPYPDRPPHPEESGWDSVFDWFYGYGRPEKRMTLQELADAIGYSLSHVQTMKGQYDAEHGTAIRMRKEKHKKAQTSA